MQLFRLRLGGLLILSTALFATLHLGCSDSPTVGRQITPAQQADAAASMGLTFPPGTQFLLYHRTTGGPDDAVHLKIALPANALATFLAQPPFATATWSPAHPFVHDNANWPQWRPRTATKFRTAQFQHPPSDVLNVLIDDSSGEPVTVYLMWHQT